MITPRRRIQLLLVVASVTAAALIIYTRQHPQDPSASTAQRKRQMSPPSSDDVRITDSGSRAPKRTYDVLGDDAGDNDDDSSKEAKPSVISDTLYLQLTVLPEHLSTTSRAYKRKKTRRPTTGSSGGSSSGGVTGSYRSRTQLTKRQQLKEPHGDIVISANQSTGVRISSDYKLIRRLADFNLTSQNHVLGADEWSTGRIRHDRDRNAEIAFYHGIERIHVTCDDIRRYGNVDDGGWNVCMSMPYTLEQGNCIVYSFGINNDFSFDDATSGDLGCQVFAFDPSMSVEDYTRKSGVGFFQLGLGNENTVTEAGWKLMTLDSIRRRLRHSNVVIDLLKIDIEYSEWKCLSAMISAGSLRDVRQLVLEIHTPEVIDWSTTERQFMQMWSTLADMESIGFRRYSVLRNPHGEFNSTRTARLITCCYNLGYINIRFLV